MILDDQLLFSEAQAITSTADSTNVIDLSNVRDIGVGEDLFIFAVLTEALNDSSGTDATLSVGLTTDDNASLSSDTALQTLFTFAHGNAAGTFKYARINPASFERYIGLVYTVANGPFDAGKVTAGIVKDIQKYTSYASGFTIA